MDQTSRLEELEEEELRLNKENDTLSEDINKMKSMLELVTKAIDEKKA